MAKAKPKYERGVIAADDAGFVRTTYFPDGTVVEVPVKWSETLRVAAFKRNFFAYDLLCLGFETEEGTVEIDEQMEGWEAITDALPKYLSGVRPIEDWFLEVVKPAFATNFTLIFPPQ